jgi:hypothetical protein
VKADNSDSLGWSLVWNFAFDTTAPTVPNLVYPTNNSWLNRAQFIWNQSQDNVSGVKEYELQISSDSSFTNPTSYTVTDTTVTISNLNKGIYYWRVRAEDNTGNLSGWSGVRIFRLDITGPTVPNLVYPTNRSLLNTTRIIFIWNRSQDNLSGVKEYELQIASSQSFVNPITFTTSDTTLSVNNLNNGVYYWRVSAKDNAGNSSGWSDVWSYEINMTALNTPKLVTPVGGYLRNTTLTFVWTSVSKLTKYTAKPAPVVYDFYIDTTSNFAHAIDTTIQDTTLILTLPEVVINYNSGNGRYEGQIPAVSQAGDSVYYYVWASDRAGNEATDPANAPGSCYRFRVITTNGNDVVPSIKVFTKGSLIIIKINSPQPTEVKLSIYDITGRPTYGPITKKISSGLTKLEVQVPRAGIYFYEVETPFMKDKGKVVIVR